jgi:hypothetical protein
MAVIGYQCSVCKRTINLVQNKAGLDWVGNCNITLGCRGQLIQQTVYQDYVRGSIPPDVIGLKNWVQRQVLYNFTQTVTRQNWVITHNLGIMPSVQVYVNQPISGNNENLVEILPTEIIYNSDDQLTLILPAAYVGIAQLIGRASNPDILNPRPRPAPVTTAPTIQLTNQGEITIASRVSTVDIPLGLVNPVTGLPNPMAGLPLTMSYTPSTGTPLAVGYVASNIKSQLSPWSDVDRVLFKGKVYTVRTFNVQTGNVQIPNGSSVALTGISLPSSITLPMLAVNPPANTFTIATDYSEDFTPGTNFLTNNIAGSLNWVVDTVLFDPVTNETTISPTGVIPPTFSLPATLVLPGVRQIVPNEVIILLGNLPFTIYDKIDGSYVDMTAVDSPGTQFDMYYNAGDLFINTSIEESVYPPIRSV